MLSNYLSKINTNYSYLSTALSHHKLQVIFVLRVLHPEAVCQILIYLKGCLGKGVLFSKKKGHRRSEVYADVDGLGVSMIRSFFFSLFCIHVM
jgi:hypothetical protein